jgi:hypothetical protein
MRDLDYPVLASAENIDYVAPCLFNFVPGGGGVFAQNPHIMPHLSYPGHRRLNHTRLDTALRPICLDTDTLHDVVAGYCLTIFCRPSSRIGYQVDGTHDFCRPWHSGRLHTIDKGTL